MDSKYDVLKLKNQLCYPLYLCSKEVTRKYGPILESVDLTYTQYIVMMYLWEMGNGNVKEIGSTLLLDPSTLTPLLKKLEAKGYITRIRSSIDERNLEIKLTDKGAKLKDKALSIPAKVGECLNLSEADANTLYKLLYKVLENVIKEEK